MEAHPEPTDRDTTDEWRITRGQSPATVAELEGRIDVALATARSAEGAALEIGAASLEAADQARRAAALAERASAAAADAAKSAREASVTPIRPEPSLAAADESPSPPEPTPAVAAGNGPVPVPVPRGSDPFDDRIVAFRLRAEKVMLRLQKIEAGAPSHEPTEVVRLT